MRPFFFAMLTTEPGDDVKLFHNQQVAVVRPENLATWLHLTKPEGGAAPPAPGRLPRPGNGTAGVGLISPTTAEATRALSDVHHGYQKSGVFTLIVSLSGCTS